VEFIKKCQIKKEITKSFFWMLLNNVDYL
jgi:hypothetical protein